MNEKRRSRSGDRPKIRERKNSTNKDGDFDGHPNINSILEHDSKFQTQAKFGGASNKGREEVPYGDDHNSKIKVEKRPSGRDEHKTVETGGAPGKEDDKLRELNDKLKMRKRVKENIKENTEEN